MKESNAAADSSGSEFAGRVSAMRVFLEFDHCSEYINTVMLWRPPKCSSFASMMKLSPETVRSPDSIA